MEVLNALEKKMGQLVELVKKLQQEKTELSKQNTEWKEKVEALEELLLKGTAQTDELSKEKKSTKKAVDDLIKSIDLLIENESV